MNEFILLMHACPNADPSQWGPWFEVLRKAGRFQAGSSMGEGICLSRTGPSAMTTGHIDGYVKITARDLADAQTVLHGNPVFEAGGIVEIRSLPRDE